MFSSRRYSPRYRSRQYYHKRNINRKFSPAAYKNNPPTYYQQKGRIIQTSPLNLYQVPRQLPNSQTLDKMYNTLVKAKYPGLNPQPTPTPPQPPIPLQPYIVQISTNLSSIYDIEDKKMTPFRLYELVTASGQLTDLPAGWDYRFDLFNIIFNQVYNPNTSNTSQFHLDLTHPLFTDNTPYQFVIKSVTTSASTSSFSVSWVCSLIPNGANSAKITRAAYTSASITITTPTIATNDSIVSDNGWYPILSTSFEDEINFIEYVLNSGSNPSLNVTYTVLCTPIQV